MSVSQHCVEYENDSVMRSMRVYALTAHAFKEVAVMRFAQQYVLLYMLLLLFFPLASVQAGVLISPARLEAVIGADGHIPEVTLLNRGPEAVTVRFRLVGGGHDLVGMPRFAEDRATTDRLAAHITFSPQECILRAGEICTVVFQLQKPLQGGLYPALVADIIPLGSAKGGIVATTRIAIPMLLTATDVAEQTKPLLRSQSLSVTQPGVGAPLQIAVEVHNFGDKHVHTGGRALISGPQGEMMEVVLPPVTILPGFARQLSTQWAPPALPQGDYVVRFVPDSAPEAVAQAAMRIVRPYELAAVDVHIEQVQVSHDGPGVVLIQALVGNRGNVAGAVELELRLLSLDGTLIARSAAVGEIAATSGRLFSSPLHVANMVPGEYLVQALVQQQGVLAAAWQESIRLPATQLVQR
jgi:hypothetical protein